MNFLALTSWRRMAMQKFGRMSFQWRFLVGFDGLHGEEGVVKFHLEVLYLKQVLSSFFQGYCRETWKWDTLWIVEGSQEATILEILRSFIKKKRLDQSQRPTPACLDDGNVWRNCRLGKLIRVEDENIRVYNFSFLKLLMEVHDFHRIKKDFIFKFDANPICVYIQEDWELKRGFCGNTCKEFF